MRLRLHALVLALVPLAACAFAIDNAGTVCGENICPTGWSCIGGLTCEPPDGDAAPRADAHLDGDGAPIIIDAGPFDPDANVAPPDAGPLDPDAGSTQLLGCGDGLTRAGIEDCDPPSPTCSPLCQRCEGGLITASGECVYLGSEAEWSTGILKCGEGGRGATLASNAEAQAVASAFGRDVWVFGEFVKSVFGGRWLTNEAFNVAIGVDAAVGSCMVVTAAGALDGRDCSAATSALCERGTPIVQPGGRAFRIVYPPVPGNEAIARCQFVGGTLADAAAVNWAYAREGGRVWVVALVGDCTSVEITPGVGISGTSNTCSRAYPVLCEFP